MLLGDDGGVVERVREHREPAARKVGRTGEMAVVSIGASRRQLIGQLLSESRPRACGLACSSAKAR
jgi:hypothetical protein